MLTRSALGAELALATSATVVAVLVVLPVAGRAFAVEVALVGSAAAATAYSTIQATSLRSRLAWERYAALQLLTTATRVAGALMPPLMGSGWRGAFAGYAAGLAIGGTAAAFVRLAPAPGLPKGVRVLLAYGAPLTLVGLGTTGLLLLDRVILGALRDSQTVGLYAVAYSVADQPVSLISSTLMLPAFPKLVSLYELDREQPSAELARRVALWLASVSPVVVLLLLFREQIVTLLAGDQFRGASRVVPLVAIGSCAYGLTQYAAVPLQLRQRTRLYGVLVFGAALANGILNVLLIPVWGLVGAAVATLVAYLVLLCACIAVTRTGEWIRRVRRTQWAAAIAAGGCAAFGGWQHDLTAETGCLAAVLVLTMVLALRRELYRMDCGS
jgi:O-antigen/teichoic acid export membrane protein